MGLIPVIQGWLMLGLSVISFGLSIAAFIHALVHKPETFVAADKRTKTFWLLITGGASVLAFLSLPPGGFSGRLLITILPIIGAAVYLTDVRPALKTYSKRPRGGGSGPSGWRTW